MIETEKTLGAHLTMARAAHPLMIRTSEGVEVVCIKHDGRIFWRGREVETDQDFKSAMIDLRDYFLGVKK